MTLAQKEKKLQLIAEEIASCTVCKIGKSGKAVPGEGNADAKMVFIGEAPGKLEAVTGKPFIGRSGKLLRNLIAEAGIAEDDVFITSPVKYLPDRGTPTKEDIAHGRVHLLEQLKIIQPEIVVLLGSSAVQGVLEKKLPILQVHGQTIENEGITYFITLHPAAVLRNPRVRPYIFEDFKNLKEKLLSRLK